MTYHPGVLNKVNSMLNQISEEQSERFYLDEAEYQMREDNEEYLEQIRADIKEEDHPNL